MLRFRLLQAREPGDPVRHEELLSFAGHLEVSPSNIVPHDMLEKSCSLDAVCDGVDGVLVGGSGDYSVLDDAPWLQGFLDTLGELANSGFPTFASCFGFQGMVLALGGEVVHDSAAAEVGSFTMELTEDGLKDPLFQTLPKQFMAQEGHKDRALSLPSGLECLASSTRCPYQAFRIPNTPVYATQFHPELSGPENRARFARYADAYRQAFGRARAEEILDSFTPSPESDGLLFSYRQRFLERVLS